MEHLKESGWVKDLPEGWLGGKFVVLTLCRALEGRFSDDDLASWMDEPDALAHCRFWGGTEQEARHSIKLNEHTIDVLHRAFAGGELAPSLFDGREFRSIPQSAFRHRSVVRNACLVGLLDIDPFWDDEWWAWNNTAWVLKKTDFDLWLASSAPYEIDDLPVPEGRTEQFPTLALRPPTGRSRVSLSEAVSWIAFGFAFEGLRFEMALQWDGFCNGDIVQAQREAENALSKLLASGADGKIGFYGRHASSRTEKGATSAAILPLHLDDYQGYVIGRDELSYGKGLRRTYTDKASSHWLSSERDDLYVQVTVNRDDLMSHFPVTRVGDATGELAPESLALSWDDYDESSLPDLRRLSEQANRDEWWTWPEAIAWIGSRDANKIATLRYWGLEWVGRAGGDRDPTLILSAQAFIAKQFCKSGREADAELLHAIQCGQVVTSGRLSKGAVATDLQASIWRGGTVVWHDGEAVLVDAKQKLTAWAFDVAIRRKDLVATFPPEGSERLVSGGKVPANRSLNHDVIIQQAATMLASHPSISIGSAAASIVADLPRNPKTGKRRDTRHIERMIAHLWEGKLA